MHIISRIYLAIWSVKRRVKGVDSVYVNRSYRTNNKFVSLTWNVYRKDNDKRVGETIFERFPWEHLLSAIKQAEQFTVPDEIRLCINGPAKE